ncbi:MAG: transposase [Thermotogaceae bacterium]|nr:transposase [Thermotogaceae bacterium]
MKEMVKLVHPGHVVTLAMMITGIVMGHNAQLSMISAETPVEAKEKSIEMRLRRWVKHEKINADTVYLPFARQILEALSGLPLVLVMDGSQIGRGCMVLMVGVLYKKRALPLAWVVYEGKKGHTTGERHIEALEKVLPLVPAGSEVVLLGDAEYDTTEMLTWMEENTNWQYVLRTSPQIYVLDGAISQPIDAYPLQKGQIFQRSRVGFTQKASIYVNLIGWWGSRHEKPIYLISNIVNAYQACKYYRRRFQIETFFSDQKSRGFYVHKSHLSDPSRLSRMLIAACLAYLWIVSQGISILASNQTHLIDRTDRIDKSLFRLGLDWLKYVLKKNLDFEPSFRFQTLESIVNVR